MRTLMLALAIVALCASASAETKTIRWQDVLVSVDTEVWRMDSPEGSDPLVLTCIAADCAGMPKVYGTIGKTGASCAARADDGNWRRALPVGAPAEGQLRFSATSRWSGCRARDEPILEACAEHGGTTYAFASRIGGGGCNFRTQVPAARLLELLRAVRADGR
jgi:hypothetical protein